MKTESSRSLDLAERLVRHAARAVPGALRERMEEEWLADLAERRGTGSRLRFALGLHWASQIIAVEQPSLLLAGAGSAGVGTLPVFSRRASSLLLVAVLHAGVFYAAWISLARTHRSPPPTGVVVRPLPPIEKPKFTPESPVDLKPVRLTDVAPPPVIEYPPEVPRDTGPGSENLVTREPPWTGGTELARPEPKRVTGGPAAGFPNVDEFYPAASVRGGEEGATTVRVCVTPQGRLDGEPATLQSSGFARLDAAGLKVAKAGSGHYRASTEDGRAIASCFAYSMRFQLKNVH